MIEISFLLGITLLSIASFAIWSRISYHHTLITLYIICSPLPLLAYTQAWTMKWYLISFFLCSLCISLTKILKISGSLKNNLYKIFQDKFKTNNPNISFNKNKFLLVSIFSSILSIYFSYKLLPINWRFEAHDVLYYSWLNDVFNIIGTPVLSLK